MSATITTRALVLGGGGLAGIAWEVGVLAGLADAGVDVTGADRVIGTSAGSIVGTLVATGVDLAAVHAEHLGASGGPSTGPAEKIDMAAIGGAFAEAMSAASDEQDMRVRIGAFARTITSPAEQERKVLIATRLPVLTWPDRDLRVTAVDTASGDAVAFTRADGVDLVDAVASSCAVPGVWPPITIGERRYMDGGMASIVHVDEADRPDAVGVVLVVAPLDPPPGGPFAPVGAEADRRRAAFPDATILAVTADEASTTAFGVNVLDPASMPASAQAGWDQGHAVAADVAALWGSA